MAAQADGEEPNKDPVREAEDEDRGVTNLDGCAEAVGDAVTGIPGQVAGGASSAAAGAAGASAQIPTPGRAGRSFGQPSEGTGAAEAQATTASST